MISFRSRWNTGMLFICLTLLLSLNVFGQIDILNPSQKIALIIGNSNYRNTSSLPNAVNDAELIAQTLRDLDFTVVSEKNLTFSQMQTEVDRFSQMVKPGSVVFFFYAGHGLQKGGKNYLIPVDYNLSNGANGLWDVGEAISQFSLKSSMNIVVLDSCRNLPEELLKKLQAETGFSVFKRTPAGTFVGFSTSPGDVALDANGAEQNSPYTSSLAKSLKMTPAELNQVFIATQIETERSTRGRQVPWRNASTKAAFFFSKDRLLARPQPAASLISTLVKTLNISGAYSEISFMTPYLNEQGTIVGRKPGKASRFLENLGSFSVPPIEMAAIKGGRFMMGATGEEISTALEEARQFDEYEDENYEVLAAELPRHAVDVRNFFMSRQEITQSQYLAVVGKLPQIPGDKQGGSMPVVNVTWSEANEFCSRLSELTGRFYRLPTEAEWEYAARAGTTTPFAFGQTINPQVAAYNSAQPYGKAPRGPKRNSPVEVGALSSTNGFGLQDMHGNVWEWVTDYWHSDYSGSPTDGSAWDRPQILVFEEDEEEQEDNSRVIRGGSWNSVASRNRSASRFRVSPSIRRPDVGFRIVAAPE